MMGALDGAGVFGRIGGVSLTAWAMGMRGSLVVASCWGSGRERNLGAGSKRPQSRVPPVPNIKYTQVELPGSARYRGLRQVVTEEGTCWVGGVKE